MTRSVNTKNSSRATPAVRPLFAAVWLCLTPVASAQDTIRTGANTEAWATVSVGAAGRAAALADDGADAGLVNIELEASAPIAAGAFTLLLEAEAGPPDPAASPSRTAADAGPFAVSSGEARLVAFHYTFSHASGDWSLGYVEARNYVDFSAVANDDKTQFAKAAFVNNPTLALPGSRLGLSWQRTARSGASGHNALLAQDDDAGAFLTAEAWWEVSGQVARLGAWQGRHGDGCEGAHSATRGRGLYAGLDGRLAGLQWNVRAGLGQLGEGTTAFLGGALEAPLRNGRLGMALGREKAMTHGGTESARHAELYYRLALPGGLWLLPGVQFTDTAAAGMDWSASLRFVLAI